MTTRDYDREARETALEMVREFTPQIIKQLLDVDNEREVSNDYSNDYSGGDDWLWTEAVDRGYSPPEAAQVLDDLGDHAETDSGLWQGQDPRKAIVTQAAFTYEAAVSFYWSRVIAAVNEARDDPVFLDMVGADDPADEKTLRGWIDEWACEALGLNEKETGDEADVVRGNA